MNIEAPGRWKAVGISGGRSEREDYSDADGRMDPSDCEHTQFLDMQVTGLVYPSVGRCLDCGHAIYLATKELFDEVPNPLLDDDKLVAQRAVHRAIWFSGLMLPQGAVPGE